MIKDSPTDNKMRSNNSSKVLIVEDSEEMLWVMANVLEKAGFSVDAVTTGGEAIERVKKNPEIELVVLNYLLPDMSGLNVMEQIKANGCKAEVIAVSAFGEIRNDFIKAGAFAFLEKPFDIRDFVRLCKHVLHRNTGCGSPM